MSAVEQHLRNLGMMQAHCFKSNNPKGHKFFNYSSVEDYVLDNGEVMGSSTTLTDGELETVLKAASFSKLAFEPKQCYHNAMMLVIHDRHDKIEYCEGYAFTGGIPVPHAWNAINGKVIDLTRSLREEAAEEFIEGKPPQADLRDRVLGTFPDHWEYRGVTFDPDRVLGFVSRYEKTGSLIGDFEGGYPLFTEDRKGVSEPFDPDAWGKLMEMAEGADDE